MRSTMARFPTSLYITIRHHYKTLAFLKVEQKTNTKDEALKTPVNSAHLAITHHIDSCYNEAMTEQKQQKTTKAPSLLRGLFSSVLAITSSILLLSWAIINYQVEQLVATRTTEYAHSIAQIAANSSAEALLSEDKLQLQMLVENVAKDPYIRSATIFAEDGQTVVQFPVELFGITEKNPLLEAENSQPTTTDEASQEKENTGNEENTPNTEANGEPSGNDTTTLAPIGEQAEAYIESQNDIPFIEKIVYQDVTAGWFKIALNRELLESSFRQSLKRSQNIILIITFILMTVLLVITFRFERRIKSLANMCHRLIQVNASQMPHSKKDWLATMKELSETSFQALEQHPHLPSEQGVWVNSRRATNTLFCYCQFSMREQESEQTAQSLTLAEHYLQAAVQAHGVQSQGDILSDCLIPFLDTKDEAEALTEAIALVHLVKELLASLDLQISMRAFVAKGTVLVLENERGVITGVSLSNRLHDKIAKLSPLFSFDKIITIAIDSQALTEFAEIEEAQFEQVSLSSQVYSISQINEVVKQQTNRQINYIIANN